jgi:hypothetical protein
MVMMHYLCLVEIWDLSKQKCQDPLCHAWPLMEAFHLSITDGLQCRWWFVILAFVFGAKASRRDRL